MKQRMIVLAWIVFGYMLGIMTCGCSLVDKQQLDTALEETKLLRESVQDLADVLHEKMPSKEALAEMTEKIPDEEQIEDLEKSIDNLSDKLEALKETLESFKGNPLFKFR